MGEEEIAATALDMLIIHSPHICTKRIKALCKILTIRSGFHAPVFFTTKRVILGLLLPFLKKYFSLHDLPAEEGHFK